MSSPVFMLKDKMVTRRRSHSDFILKLFMRYVFNGIASVVSIIEDLLIESMRSYYYPFANLPFVPITAKEKDYRSKRITDYLNLVNHIVTEQIQKLKNEVFEAGSEIVKYFEMLPDDNKAKQLYRRMMYIS